MTTEEVFHELKNRLAGKTPDQLANSQGTYQFNLSGDDGAQYYVTVTPSGATVEAGTAPAPGVTISMTAADFKALAGGQLNPMSAFMSGKLSVAGDMGLALKLQTLIS
ncbi:Sterol-binding domain protein [Sulfobacillus acidophilus TPY]|uniref:Sterol-binding domain protein n=1 Tax=Sulfobacillus acidophilus (strain ATCC 700253 / DSM 10332 / NAL) TaxID=679936 RepID=G8U078_SULAD|nr:Sterol-binding domain protein [Sulfobacillus acidophilus TPY]AEW05327.1 Sterol-binding domain protein [Sulfobacillus acidophilus DSM 10332]